LNRSRPAAGVLLVAKPSGPTSRAVVDAVVRALGTHRVGHAGTLDPFADGLLIVAWEKATALLTYLQGQAKTYVATVHFGRATDTQDRTGRVLAERDAGALTAEAVRDGLAPFRGTIDQVPPMYSAVKSGGERLYEIARRGETRERAARTREVHELELTSWHPPLAQLRVVCSSGTYVRTLAHDLGETLGTGACLDTLTRTGVGTFRLADAIVLDQLIELGAGEILSRAIRPADALPDWGAITVADAEAREVMCGSWRDPDRRAASGERYRVLDARGRLLALVRGGDPVEYLRVLETPEAPR
jgi:tRNA pseudouridine55 synthase